MLKLTDEQKAAIIAERQRLGAADVELTQSGDYWIAVWRDPALAPAERWRAHVVHKLVRDEAKQLLTGSPWEVWWGGCECGARTRKEAIETARRER